MGEHDYSLLSTTVHASAWGTRFYGRIFPEDPARLHLNLAPLYDPAASFTVGLVLQGTYPRPIEAFLRVCDASTAPKAQCAPSKQTTTPSSRVGRPRWSLIRGFGLQWPMRKNGSHAGKNRRLRCERSVSGSRRPTASLSILRVGTHPPTSRHRRCTPLPTLHPPTPTTNSTTPPINTPKSPRSTPSFLFLVPRSPRNEYGSPE